MESESGPALGSNSVGVAARAVTLGRTGSVSVCRTSACTYAARLALLVSCAISTEPVTATLRWNLMVRRRQHQTRWRCFPFPTQTRTWTFLQARAFGGPRGCVDCDLACAVVPVHPLRCNSRQSSLASSDRKTGDRSRQVAAIEGDCAAGVDRLPAEGTVLRVLPGDGSLPALPFAPPETEWEAASHPAIMDVTKAKRELGWEPRYSGLEALRDALAPAG